MKTFGIALTQPIGGKQKPLLRLLLPLLLAACTAPAIKPAAWQAEGLHTLLIVPVEAPPLEVVPDLVEQRDAAYRHAQNMAMGVALKRQRYQTAGGIVVAGMVGGIPSDDADALIATLPPTAAGNESGWTPTKAAAEKLRGLLALENRKAELSRHEYRLPTQADASLPDWHSAMQSWYGQETGQTNYAAHGRYDAVIELGVGKYRIFEGQTSLQLLLKLIDPVSHRVIARTHSESFRVDDEALASLERDGAAFKQLIADMAVPLLRQSLGDVGLRLPVQADES